MKLGDEYILYIYVSNDEENEMTTLNINDLQKNDESKEVVLSVASAPYVDRSEELFAQMNFIAINNMSFLNLKKH